MTTIISVANATAGEKDTYIDFVVSLNASPTDSVSVNYSTADGSAVGRRYDFQDISGTLVFAAGETTKTVRVALIDSSDVEATEGFSIVLSGALNAVIGNTTAIGTIVDNDTKAAAPVIQLSDAIVDESDGRAYITVTLDKASATALSVTFTTSDGTAAAGADYQALGNQTVAFAPGEVAKTIAINVIDDASAETGEYFDLVFSTPSGGASLPDTSARVFIAASDQATQATPVVSVADATAAEKDGYLDFVVSLSGPSDQSVSVNYGTVDGSAIGRRYDFQDISGTLVFAAGETIKTVRVALVDDSDIESTEGFPIALSGALNAVIGNSKAIGTIIDNDAKTAAPVIQLSNAIVDESDGRAYITVTLDKASANAVSVNFTNSDGTAAAGADYQTLGTQTVAFAPGEVAKTIAINVIDDASAETGEYFDLVFSTPTGGATLPDTNARVFIAVSDQATQATPVVSVADATAAEKDGYLDFVVSLSGPSAQSISVNYGTVDGSAVGRGYDFQDISGTLVFAAGETTKSVRVAVVDDTRLELTAGFSIVLSGALNAVIGNSTAVGTIIDNEKVTTTSAIGVTTTPVIQLSDAIVDESDGRAYITVTLDIASTKVVSVAFTAADGTATAGADYQTLGTQTVAFAPGEVAKTIAINVIDDASAETGEYFDLVFATPTGGATLPDTNARVFIAASDQATQATPVVSVADATVSEKDGYLDFVVSLSGPSAQSVSVNYGTVDGSAIGRRYDFQDISGTLVFAAGETTKIVRVAVAENTDIESTEGFSIFLSGAQNAVIGNSTAIGTIIDNDKVTTTSAIGVTTTPVIQLSDAIVDESDGRAYITVTLDIASTKEVSVAFTTVDGTATAGADYQALGTQAVAFAPGEVAKTIAINVNDDASAEAGEYFELEFSTPTGGATLPDTSARVFIAASDQATQATPVVSVADATVSEKDGYLDFVVSLSGPSAQSVSVNYATSEGTADGRGYDFQDIYGALVFAAGETTKTVRVAVVEDTYVETTQTLFLKLTAPTNATVSPAFATGSILDNDGSPIATGLNVTGTAVRDILIGRATSDIVNGAEGDDLIDGGAGNDTLSGGPGNDLVLGDIGEDTAVYAGASKDYTITSTSTGFTISGAIDGMDTLSMVEFAKFSDTTLRLLDTTPPTTTLFSPINEAIGAAVASNVVITFSEAIQKGVGSIVLKTTTGAEVAVYEASTSSNLTFSGRTLTINPTVDLANNTGYKVELSAGSVEDLAGNRFAGTANYKFTTTAPTNTVPPQTITGTAGNDPALTGGQGNDIINGLAGLDTAVYTARMAAHSISPNASSTAISGPDGSDSLSSIERLQFLDANLAFDLDGNAGQVYRLYQAAFNRTPDLSGLGGWIAAMDDGMPLLTIASKFMESAEFQSLYGANPTNAQFVANLYTNALHRPSQQDAGSAAGWVNQLSTNAVSKAQALVNFSESAENKASVLTVISVGITYATAAQATGPAKGQSFAGTPNTDSLIGTVGNDTFTGGSGNDTIEGGKGLDTAVFGGPKASHTIARTATGLTVAGVSNGTDTLTNVERLKFDDAILAMDTAGNAGQTYRLYQAAFNRTPDKAGLTDWVKGMDTGLTLTQMATAFIGSAEFKGKYGVSPTNAQFVDLLYTNALHRERAAGDDYWTNQLDSGVTREQALIGFSESAENQASLVGVIQNGIELLVG
jgi:hypothetical protein